MVLVCVKKRNVLTALSYLEFMSGKYQVKKVLGIFIFNFFVKWTRFSVAAIVEGAQIIGMAEHTLY